MGFKANSHLETKLETHLLPGLGARIQNSLTEPSITGGDCCILIKNNEGNRKNTAKANKQLPIQRSMGYKLD